ncbi:biotin-dependent carboxyltransferase family protein [Pararhodobacter sp.]|uniref:5-oxoprolinase subunit C family protein n=1 Tax=Pararhodobacter sp. TaxID=2127056 RepID=UPI002AFF897F|nr:biotin-dependent carboxyltransferase family protein [Pararhodobacter sp.]
MAEAVFRVVQAGPLVSVQDGGRPGMMRFGVPASGGMDRKALALANLALGQPEGSPVIEVSLGGLTLECVSGRVSLAVTGGAFVVEAGGHKTGSWQVLTIEAGERLVIRRGHWGAWAYLAFAGTLQAPRWLGSAATLASSNLGGGVLKAGQDWVVAEAEVLPPRDLPRPVSARPRRGVHVVMGPQAHCFAPEALEAFATGPWFLTPQGDRMGVRLKGPALALGDALSIPSEPIVRGSVQVAGDGVPVVLLADHQTTGGYPKIATVLDDDLDAFAQLRPGDGVAFTPISAEEAAALGRFRAERWAEYKARMRERTGEAVG